MSFVWLENSLKRVGIDRYMILLILTVGLASLLPARGQAAVALSHVTYWAVALLFFLYGAKLATATIVAGFTNWRLQIAVLLCTFVLFPLLGLAMRPLTALWLPAVIGVGFLYISCLPSTVQSSIAFTSISRGNVAGAVCAASFSNLAGVIISPLLFSLLIKTESQYSIDLAAIWKIMQQVLLPFVVGQFCRPLLAGFLSRHKLPTMIVDRSSILLIVYSAFSAGAVNGIWQVISPQALLIVTGFCGLLLAVVMAILLGTARIAAMSYADRMALLYCGSTKSLATGLPIAGILFANKDISLIVLPLMIYHLMQLMVCAVIAQRASTGSDVGGGKTVRSHERFHVS